MEDPREVKRRERISSALGDWAWREKVMAETKRVPMPRGKKGTWGGFMVLASG